MDPATTFTLTLGDLADPELHQEPLDVVGESGDTLREHLRRMLLIRMVEEHLALKRKEGCIGGPVHLGVGQEAIAVGVSHHLRSRDRVFGAHRSHSHLLALGGSLRGLFAEVLGKDTGLSRGMGGSMHLWDGPRGFLGSVPIVGGTVPLAVGAGLAARMQGIDAVGVSYFGDGAVEEGGVQESFNLARVLRAPVLFVAENNLFASHMEISLRQPRNTTARFAVAHDMPLAVVDGNDVLAVRRAADRLLAHARSGGGPAYLEAVTYRWYGHVDWREDIDVGVNRSVDHLEKWKARDPIGRLSRGMEAAGLWSAARHDELVAGLRDEVARAWNQADADPWPEPGRLMEYVFAPHRGGRSA